jgi:hypothetical protein
MYAGPRARRSDIEKGNTMYFPDMSAYSYYLNFSIAEVKNVGWIDAKHDFEKGIVDPRISEKLRKILIKSDLVDAHVNVIRSAHPCNICGEEDIVSKNEQDILLGRSELWIPGSDYGEYFAAPTLILHYMKHHSYLPPAEFIKAVGNFSLNTYFNAQEVYLGLVSKYGFTG